MGCCAIEEEDPSTFPTRVRTFVSDRGLGALTGPRRMAREDLVRKVAEIASSEGHRVLLVPGDAEEHPDILMFYHWSEIDESVVSRYPDADVLYGQDLCHQVPAIVRGSRSL